MCGRPEGLERLAGRLVKRLYRACRTALAAQTEGEGPLVVEPIETLPLSADALDRIASGEPYVAVTSLGGAHRIDIIDRDRAGLFADTAGLLAAHGFVVRSAIVRTIDGLAVNEWWVDSPGSETPLPEVIARDLVRVAKGTGHPSASCSGASARGCAAPSRAPSTDARHGRRRRVRLRDGHGGPRNRPARAAPGHRSTSPEPR